MGRTGKQPVNASGLFEALNYDEPKRLRVLAGAQVLEFLVELRRRMDAQGLKKAELARRIGVERSQVARWLAAENGLNAKSMFLLAQGLGSALDLQWAAADVLPDEDDTDWRTSKLAEVVHLNAGAQSQSRFEMSPVKRMAAV